VLNLKLSHHTPRGRLGERRYSPSFFDDLGTRWGSVVKVTPWPCFSPGERTPGTPWTGNWVGHKAGLDTEVTGKLLLPLPGIEPRSPGRPARNQTLYWLCYPAQPEKICCLQNKHHSSSWWWRQHVPLKRRSTIILHGSTSQKTNLNIIVVGF
jgi:hypothetical protein